MSLTTLILDLMVVGLSLMLLGWVYDLVRSHPSRPDAPRRPDLPHAQRGPAARTSSDLAFMPERGSWSRWTEN
jgi:hypothetical protein